MLWIYYIPIFYISYFLFEKVKFPLFGFKGNVLFSGKKKFLILKNPRADGRFITVRYWDSKPWFRGSKRIGRRWFDVKITVFDQKDVKDVPVKTVDLALKVK